MHSHTDEYVDLFPVHPAYFENFQKINTGRSQREILKTLSKKFKSIQDDEIPANQPGLICYDSYWLDMAASRDLQANADVYRVTQVMAVVDQKIDDNFTGARKNKCELAHRIANATAIKLLQADLDKTNGATAEILTDELCYLDDFCGCRELLLDVVSITANTIITATAGQFFERNNANQEYHLRIEGGVNFEQKIKDFAAQMSVSQKDEYFYQFMVEVLPIELDPYRIGFKIWKHSIEWLSHKIDRDGYIFMGNPAAKSTTQPQRHFYIYIMPMFDDNEKKINTDADEIYFNFDECSDELKSTIALFGAAKALEHSADSSQKKAYAKFRQDYFNKLRSLLDNEFVSKTTVYYQGKQQMLSSYQIQGGLSKEQIISHIASLAFESYFNEENPDYPKFTSLQQPIVMGENNNFSRFIKSAKQKIANPMNANRDGEGVLAGLGLWADGKLQTDTSMYARSIKQMMTLKGAGKVLNRDEILECYWLDDNLYLSKDFKIEADFEFLVLATMAALGEIEIKLSSGKAINAANIADILNLDSYEYYSFTHIAKPKGLNMAVVKEIFMLLLGHDLSSNLNAESFAKLITAAEERAKTAAKLEYEIANGYSYAGVEIISPTEAVDLKIQLSAFRGFCDKMKNYNSEAKLKNLPWTIDEIRAMAKYAATLQQLQDKFSLLNQFGNEVKYLNQAVQYVTDQNFANDINKALGKLATIVTQNDANSNSQYLAQLQQLHTNYAQWYVDVYVKHHISNIDNAEKQRLVNSEMKAICDVGKDAVFVNNARYEKWVSDIHLLQVADDRVTLEAVKETPYMGFNPKDYVGKTMPQLSDLKTQLQEIFDEFIAEFTTVLDDPSVKSGIDALGQEDQQLIRDFQTGSIKVDRNYAAPLTTVIGKLYHGFTKIEWNHAQLLNIFSRPMSPDEMLAALKKALDTETIGKDRSTIRVIVK